MFGYINIDKDKLTDGEQGLYQTFMCGLCLSTKHYFTNFARLTVNYDINYYNVLFHSIQNIDVTINQQRCIAYPIKKRTIISTNDITDKLSIVNVMLVYLNVYDDVVDGGSWKKRAMLAMLKKDYHKAKSLMPDIAEKLESGYNKLRQLEKDNCNNLDQVCHPFAVIAQDTARAVLGDSISKDILDLCYNTGKWIYLIDALDDLYEDSKSGNYNPLIACCNMDDRQDIESKVQELNFIFFSVLNRLAQCYNDLTLSKYHCILNNIIYDYIRERTKSLIQEYKSGDYALSRKKRKAKERQRKATKYKLERTKQQHHEQLQSAQSQCTQCSSQTVEDCDNTQQDKIDKGNNGNN